MKFITQNLVRFAILFAFLTLGFRFFLHDTMTQQNSSLMIIIPIIYGVATFALGLG